MRNTYVSTKLLYTNYFLKSSIVRVDELRLENNRVQIIFGKMLTKIIIIYCRIVSVYCVMRV